MSKRPSATYNDPGYFYSQKKLLKIFTVAMLLLAAGIIAMIWADWDRDWKDTQRAEMRWEARKLAVEEMILEQRSQKDRGRLERARREAEERIARNQEEIERLEQDIADARGAFYLRDMVYKERKQYTLQAEYKVHEAHDPDELEEWTAKLYRYRDQEARLRDAVRAANDKLNALLEQRDALEESLAEVERSRMRNREIQRLELVRNSIEEKRDWSFLREMPLLDFLAPPTKVEQVVLDNIGDNYEFAMPKRVDRCGTCHVNAFRVGFSEQKFPRRRPEDGPGAGDGDGDGETNITNAAGGSNARPGQLTFAEEFELAVYRFVYDAIEAVTPKDKPEKLRAVEIHHETLDFLFDEYDRVTGEIGLVREGPNKGRKKWQRYRRYKGRWVPARDDDPKGRSVAEYYKSVLDGMEGHWRTHPHFDDMVGPASPHPYKEVGCTVCHLGRGWSTDFGYAHHTPDRELVKDWMTSERAEEEDRHLPLSAKMTLTEAMAHGKAPTEDDVHLGWVTDEKTEQRWKKELGRTKNKLKYWDWPQHPKMLVQSSCLKCHKAGMLRKAEEEYADVRIGKPDPDAPDIRPWADHAAARNIGKPVQQTRIFLPEEPEPYRPRNLERGEDNFMRFGCYGCHKVDPEKYPAMGRARPKVGPPLDNIVSKVQDGWLEKWVANPKAFRPDTRMPRFFHLSNNSHDYQYRFADGNLGKINGDLWNDTEIWAIVEWMKAESRKRAQPLPEIDLSKGDPKRGERLVVGDYEASKPSREAKGEAKACIACHEIETRTDALEYDAAALEHHELDRGGTTGWGARMSRRQGPTLKALGSKVKAEWLYAWLRDPRGWWKHTNMPDLRLTEQEALDITAYLMTLRDEKFEQSESIVRDRSVLEKMAIELKVSEQRETTDVAITMVQAWTSDEQAQYVGKELFKHYGCFGCHDIHEYRDATPIGTELTEWGSKQLDRLEFNHAPIQHTHFDFAYTKMRNPRVYDHGMPRRDKPLERLRMPRFGFTTEEARDLSTFLVALVNDPIQPEARFNPDDREQAIIRGREIVTRYNCQGCHVVEGEGGDIWPVIEADKWRPPDLLGQGMKTQPRWLFRFMKDPTFVSIPDPDASGGIVPGSDRVRPWHSIRMPTFHLTDDEARDVVQYFAALSRAPSDFGSKPPDTLTGPGTSYATPRVFQVKREDDPTKTKRVVANNRLQEGQAMFQQYQCKSCHSVDAQVESAAPHFRHSLAGRLRPDWIETWLWNPNALQEGTSMPGFFLGDRGEPKAQATEYFGGSAEEQIRALRDIVTRHYKD